MNFIDQLSPQTRAAAVAILALQSTLGIRLRPDHVEAMADRYHAPRGPVLALLGWAVDTHPDRLGNRIDVLTNRRPVTIPPPDSRETVFALAVCRSVRSKMEDKLVKTASDSA